MWMIAVLNRFQQIFQASKEPGQIGQPQVIRSNLLDLKAIAIFDSSVQPSGKLFGHCIAVKIQVWPISRIWYLWKKNLVLSLQPRAHAAPTMVDVHSSASPCPMPPALHVPAPVVYWILMADSAKVLSPLSLFSPLCPLSTFLFLRALVLSSVCLSLDLRKSVLGIKQN